MQINRLDRSENELPRWLYYKIYAGPLASETLLLQVVRELCAKFENTGEVKKWFYVRYADPQPHLRLRLETADDLSSKAVATNLDNALTPFVEQDIVWKTELHNYDREVERYGKDRIGLIEEIFHQDSKMTVDFLYCASDFENENLRWLFALASIASFLQIINYTVEDKITITHSFLTHFHHSNLSNQIRTQLDAKFRKHRTMIETVMENGSIDEIVDEIFLPLATRNKMIKPLLQQVFNDTAGASNTPIDRTRLLADIMHMSFNRLFMSSHTLNEMACIYLIHRHYKSFAAEKRK